MPGSYGLSCWWFGTRLGSFHSGAKSPVVLPDRYLTSELYRGILQNILVPFAKQHVRGNYRYRDDNATHHHARVVLDFRQQGNIKHIWDELCPAIASMDNPPQNFDELRQALMDKWAEIPVTIERLQHLVVSMPRRLAGIIAAITVDDFKLIIKIWDLPKCRCDICSVLVG